MLKLLGGMYLRCTSVHHSGVDFEFFLVLTTHSCGPSHSVAASMSTAHNSIALDISHVHSGTETEKDRRPSKRGRSPVNDGDDQDDVKPMKRQKSNTVTVISVSSCVSSIRPHAYSLYAAQASCCVGIKHDGLSTHRKSDIHRDGLPSEEQNKLEWWVCPNFGSCPTRQM